MSGVFSSITIEPKNTLQNVGQNIRLQCVTTNNDCTNIEWAKLEGQQSPFPIYRQSLGMLNPTKYEEARYNVSSVGGCNLEILSLKLIDSGRFICSETSQSKEDIKSAILVVIETVDPCQSDMTDGIAEGDKYEISCSVTIRSDLIIPSKVELSWFGDRQLASSFSNETINSVKSVYNGTAHPIALPQFKCGVSLHIDPTSSYDQSSATLDVCNISSKNIDYSVRNVRFSPDKKEFEINENVDCNADGYPSPNFEWKSVKTGEIWEKKSIIIGEDSSPGDTYECTAKNVVKGFPYTDSLTATVTEAAPFPVALVIGIAVGVVVAVVVIILAVCLMVPSCLLYKRFRTDPKTAGEKDNMSSHPLNESSSKPPGDSAPPKPPRASTNQVNFYSVFYSLDAGALIVEKIIHLLSCQS